MRKVILLLSLFLPPFWPTLLSAACHVMTPAGSGSNSGADWNNACIGFTSTNCQGGNMVRGDTYYLAGGSGGGYVGGNSGTLATFSTAVSGTTLITIKAATVADHCTATGFSSATMAVDGGAGQAIITTGYTAPFSFSTSYWTIDGNYQPAGGDTSSLWGNPGNACSGTQCGIKIDESTANAVQTSSGNIYGINSPGANLTNITVRSMEMVSCWTTCGSLGITTDFLRFVGSGDSNITMTHNYLHHSSQCDFQTRATTGTVIEYNYLWLNFSHVTAPPVHGCTIDESGETNLTFAFNAVNDQQGTAMIDELGSGVTTNTGEKIYGNIIWMTSGNPNGLAGGWDNGVVSCTNSQVCIGWQVYNNTIVNETLSTNNTLAGGSPVGTGSSITVENNLFYNSSPANNQCSNWTVSCTYDYNYYSGTTHNAETHEQTTSTNPFVNWPANTTAGFRLSPDTNAWTTLGSPYNVDMVGVTRTSSRGALQFGGVTISPGTLVNNRITIKPGATIR
jgi:hypothetical protein